MQALRELLDALDLIADRSPELSDTEVRESVIAAIYHGFIAQTPGYCLPGDFGLTETQSNRNLETALGRYITAATAEARKLGINTPEQRFEAYQNEAITSKRGNNYDSRLGSFDNFEAAKEAFSA